MSHAPHSEYVVVDSNGHRGTFDPQALDAVGEEQREFVVRVDGRPVRIAAHRLTPTGEREYVYAGQFDDGAAAESAADPAELVAEPAELNDGVVVPVMAEELLVKTRQVERVGARITKTVTERLETVDLPLMHETTEIERVLVDRFVESAPPVRYEGDVMILSFVEEVLVTEKRLKVREELHIRKRQTVTHKPQQVSLRREAVTVDYMDGDGASRPNGLAEPEGSA